MKKIYLLSLFCIGIILLSKAQPEFVTVVPQGSENFYSTSDYVYFSSGDSLFRTDGTAGGTIFLKNNLPDFKPLAEFNGRLLFSSNGLWSSDGTPSGTTYISEFHRLLQGVGARYYYVGYEVSTGYELYKTDGTASGTELIKDIYPGPSNGLDPSTRFKSTVLDGSLYFAANDGIHGAELWKSNGTSSGTMLVKDNFPGPISTFDLVINTETIDIFSNNSKVYFEGDDGLTGLELFETDGSQAGTKLSYEFISGMEGVQDISYLNSLNGEPVFFEIYFDTINFDNFANLWKVKPDGALLKLGNVGYTYQLTGKNVVVDDKLYFEFIRFAYLNDLWVTDGTLPGTHFVENIGFDGGFVFLEKASDYAMAVNNDQGYIINLWKSNGLTDSTKIISRFLVSADPRSLTAYDKFVFYAEHDGPGYFLPDNPEDFYQIFEVNVETEEVNSLRTIYGKSFLGSDNILVFKDKILFTTYPDYFDLTDPLIKKLWIYDPLAPKSYFTFVNADTDTDLQTISEGDTIYIQDGTNYNVRYNSQANIESVSFNSVKTENIPPYAIGGDNNGNYFPWSGATPGNKTITVEAFSENNKGGYLVESKTIHFTLVPAPASTTFTLVDAGTNLDIFSISDEQVIDLADLSSNKFNIRANTSFPGTLSIVFDYNGDNGFRTENAEPFALFGDASGNYAVRYLNVGTYTIKATPYTGLNGTGMAGPANELTFYVVNSASRISSYPNPVENNVVLDLNKNNIKQDYIIEITDIGGREVYRNTHSGNLVNIDFTGKKLASGIYIVRIMGNEINKTTRFIKK